MKHPSEVKYRRARLLNVVLGVVGVFLRIVLAAQLPPGQNPTDHRGGTTPSGMSPHSGDGTGELGFVCRDGGDAVAIGALDARVVLAQWTDLCCPF
ncbi:MULTISPECIES: hypothetical protein [unclassified Rhodococcus (in: high G+C Gram-positive bacteria)]|uniref:hypothetical protein n=1 Tax=unclassified Rhodococcus (in: high G+C Gram-positive bacteria) TaxID=192944 RepID=UPI00111508D8|nr:hypothetical protein [Rhodococcus sp. M8]QPG48441.1 hypothetical protein ISO16_27855 [Rhodococcus sp. M8]